MAGYLLWCFRNRIFWVPVWHRHKTISNRLRKCRRSNLHGNNRFRLHYWRYNILQYRYQNHEEYVCRKSSSLRSEQSCLKDIRNCEIFWFLLVHKHHNSIGIRNLLCYCWENVSLSEGSESLHLHRKHCPEMTDQWRSVPGNNSFLHLLTTMLRIQPKEADRLSGSFLMSFSYGSPFIIK